MKILLLSDSYPPEVRSASHLMFELAVGLTDRKHDVTVVTAFPGYNMAEGKTLPKGRLLSVSSELGVKIVRVWTLPFHNVGPITRGIGQLALALSITGGGLLAGKVDAILVYSPPLTMGVAALFLSRIKRAPYVLNVQDFFPQNAIDLGILRGCFPVRFFEAMESLIYKHAAVITVHSEGNARHIRAKTGIGCRMEVVHNWVDLQAYRIGDPGRAFRAREGLDGAFLVLFAGVMGYAQDLGTVIEAAKALHSEEKIVFLLVGDGVEKPKLVRKAKELGLKNVRFLPFVSREGYPELVAAADVGLVTLKKSMKTPVVPSKILGYMAAGKPFVASLNPESDANAIVKDANCGISVSPEDAEGMARAIKQLFQSRELAHEMGQRGRSYAEAHFSKERAIDCYEQLLLTCTGYKGGDYDD